MVMRCRREERSPFPQQSPCCLLTPGFSCFTSSFFGCPWLPWLKNARASKCGLRKYCKAGMLFLYSRPWWLKKCNFFQHSIIFFSCPLENLRTACGEGVLSLGTLVNEIFVFAVKKSCCFLHLVFSIPHVYSSTLVHVPPCPAFTAMLQNSTHSGTRSESLLHMWIIFFYFLWKKRILRKTQMLSTMTWSEFVGIFWNMHFPFFSLIRLPYFGNVFFFENGSFCGNRLATRKWEESANFKILLFTLSLSMAEYESSLV